MNHTKTISIHQALNVGSSIILNARPKFQIKQNNESEKYLIPPLTACLSTRYKFEKNILKKIKKDLEMSINKDYLCVPF